MPSKRNFDAELAALEALRGASPEAAEPELAKALNLRNNFLTAYLRRLRNLRFRVDARIALVWSEFCDIAVDNCEWPLRFRTCAMQIVA